MYWEDGDFRTIFQRFEEPVARKEHKCCECGKTIKRGEKYSYFVVVWADYCHNCKDFGAYKTCLECEKDWDDVLQVFHNNKEPDACRVFEALREAIQDAFDEGFLSENDKLVKKWLDVENLSLKEREEYEKKEAVYQMRHCGSPFLL